MKNVIIFILAVIIIFMGWAYYKSVMMRNQIILQSQNPTYRSGFMMSASLICKDNTHFIAEFPDTNRVNIISNGNLVSSMPLVAGAGQRYEDQTKVYIFAGEEVTVIDKATGKSTTCGQPFDPNNAPVNFGDKAEGNGQASGEQVAMLVSQNVVGEWQSLQDAKFVREFKANGSVYDYYDKKKIAEGKWVVYNTATVNNPKVAKVNFQLDSSAVYVQMIVSATQADNLNFRITKLTPEELELTYMEKSGVLTFKKI